MRHFTIYDIEALYIHAICTFTVERKAVTVIPPVFTEGIETLLYQNIRRRRSRNAANGLRLYWSEGGTADTLDEACDQLVEEVFFPLPSGKMVTIHEQQQGNHSNDKMELTTATGK